jgi:hypothetical protein
MKKKITICYRKCIKWLPSARNMPFMFEKISAKHDEVS